MDDDDDASTDGSGIWNVIKQHSFKKCMCMSTCSLQINIQIDFQSVKMCTFSSLFLFAWGGAMLPVA